MVCARPTPRISARNPAWPESASTWAIPHGHRCAATWSNSMPSLLQVGHGVAGTTLAQFLAIVQGLSCPGESEADARRPVLVAGSPPRRLRAGDPRADAARGAGRDRQSTRLNSHPK